MQVELQVLGESGHRTVIFDAATTEGGKELEQEIETLILGGNTVLVGFPGQDQMFPVVSYDAGNNAWLTREGRQPLALATQSQSKVVAIRPIVGG